MSTDKKSHILGYIVDYYIKTGKPIGSASLIKNYNLKWSSSTVRNILHSLMEDGLLAQKHVSSGRIPTEKGIRLYIDYLVESQEVGLGKNEVIEEQYCNIDGTLDQVVNNISYLLSDYTHTACLATLPSKKNMKIQSFKIVELGDRVCLVLVVFEGGITEKSYIKLDRKISTPQINRISEYVNSLTYGLTLTQLKDEILKKVKEPFYEYSTFIENLIKFSMEVMEKENKVEILINGNLSYLDYINVDNLETSKNLLHVFEEKEFLKEFMDTVVEENITKVFIGRYNGMPTGLSLIAAPYGKGINQGSLGVFGPIRMNYSEIIPLVNYTADYLTRIVGNGGTNAGWR